MNILKLFKLQRMSHNKTTEEVAKHVNLTKEEYEKIESGEKTPDDVTKLRIMRKLEFSSPEILLIMNHSNE